MNLSTHQRAVLNLMNKGYSLENHYSTEGSLYRPKEGMSTGEVKVYSCPLTVKYVTIKALLNAGLIEEWKRSLLSEAMQGERTWNTYIVSYRLTLTAQRAIELQAMYNAPALER